MSEITKEFFVEQLQKQTTELVGVVNEKFGVLDEKIDDLARMVQEGFMAERAYIEKKLDVREQVVALQIDVSKIKEALSMK